MSTQDADVNILDAALPPFWDRNVVFFANLLALFFGNEQEMACLSEKVGEVDSYGGRLIPILNLMFRGGDNVLVLEQHPDQALCDYFRNDLGLSLPKLEILRHTDYLKLGHMIDEPADISRLLPATSASGAGWVDGYVTDRALEFIACSLEKRTIATPEGSQRGNNKWLLFRHVQQQNLPFVPGETIASPGELSTVLRRLTQLGFRSAVIKSQIGASGIGMLKLPGIDGSAELPPLDDHLFFEGPPMVQGWIEPGIHGVRGVLSPSVQMFLDDDTVHLFDVTEQILSEQSIHEGNESPPPRLQDQPATVDELFRQAGIAGQWLHSQGYRGTASVDFLVAEKSDGSEPDVYVCEINARVTGATYPSVLARQFNPRGAWFLRNIRVAQPLLGHELLRCLAESGSLYRAGQRRGVLPLNFNSAGEGLVYKAQFLCLADTVEQCRRLLDSTIAKLPGQWQFETD